MQIHRIIIIIGSRMLSPKTWRNGNRSCVRDAIDESANQKSPSSINNLVEISDLKQSRGRTCQPRNIRSKRRFARDSRSASTVSREYTREKARVDSIALVSHANVIAKRFRKRMSRLGKPHGSLRDQFRKGGNFPPTLRRKRTVTVKSPDALSPRFRADDAKR